MQNGKLCLTWQAVTTENNNEISSYIQEQHQVVVLSLSISHTVTYIVANLLTLQTEINVKYFL